MTCMQLYGTYKTMMYNSTILLWNRILRIFKFEKTSLNTFSREMAQSEEKHHNFYILTF